MHEKHIINGQQWEKVPTAKTYDGIGTSGTFVRGYGQASIWHLTPKGQPRPPLPLPRHPPLP